MLLPKNEQISDKLKDKIRKLAVEDSILSCRLCLILIMIMELYFIATWLIFERSFDNINELRYLIAYSFLFSFALVLYILLSVFEKDKENGFKKIRILQAVGVVAIMLWSVVITVFDADHHTEFSYIIYATIAVLLPSVIYINTMVLNITYIKQNIAV